MKPMKHQAYNDLVALGAAAVVVVASLAGLGLAQTVSSGPPALTTVSYLNLTISINATYGVPQYSPANFTVPAGLVLVTISDNDSPAYWSGCACNVTGTLGSTVSLNGTPLHQLNDQNVAHTFTVPSLGINVPSPGQASVSFTLDLTQTGSFTWLCLAPCGSDGYGGFPMDVPGFMTGTMTVV